MTALIIDDDRDLCLLLKVILNDFIADVQFAQSIESGIKLFGELRPDVVFVDNNLPDGQGVNLISDFKALEPSCRIIFITANSGLEQQTLTRGANKFLVKPLTHSAIYNALNTDTAVINTE